MPEQPPVIAQLKCPNPACGYVVKVKKPAKPGKYSLPCPKCGTKIALIVAGPKVPPGGVVPGGMNPGGQNPGGVQEQNVPNNMLAQPKWDKFTYMKGDQSSVPCAFGCGYTHQVVPEQVGENIFMCPKCKGKTKFNVRDKTVGVTGDLLADRKAFRGKLILLRPGWGKKEFQLKPGSNIIGRYDRTPGAEADIAIKDDPSMSRRSIDISVGFDDLSGFRFNLTVLKATNPVLINHMPVCTGESVALNYGDSIILGKTQFRFEKDVNY